MAVCPWVEMALLRWVELSCTVAKSRKSSNCCYRHSHYVLWICILFSLFYNNFYPCAHLISFALWDWWCPFLVIRYWRSWKEHEDGPVVVCSLFNYWSSAWRAGALSSLSTVPSERRKEMSWKRVINLENNLWEWIWSDMWVQKGVLLGNEQTGTGSTIQGEAN